MRNRAVQAVVIALLIVAVLAVALGAIVGGSHLLAAASASSEPVVTAKRFTPEHVDRHLDCTPHTYAGGRHAVLCDWQNVPVADRYELRVNGRWQAVSEPAYTRAHIGAPRP